MAPGRREGGSLASAWAVWPAALRRIVTHGLGIDARLGLRLLVKQPLITTVAVLALGLGIPASLFLLHGMDVLYSDLPVPEAIAWSGFATTTWSSSMRHSLRYMISSDGAI